MSDLQNQNPQEYKDALERLIRETAQEYEELTMYEKLGDIARMLSMSYIAKTYFGKSRSWLAQKLHANMVNGEPAKFTDAELATLKAALDDISKKIGSVSSTL